MPSPEVIYWVKIAFTVIGGSGISGAALIATARWFIVRPVVKAEAERDEIKKERDEYKKLWKDEQIAREKRIDAAELALYGRPSMRPRHDGETTKSMLIEYRTQRQHEEDLQRRMLAERAARLPQAEPLEAFSPPPEPPLYGSGGRQDYDDNRGTITPIDVFNPNKKRR